jgi:hypothetical protein
MDGDDAIKALAERVESQLMIKAGKVTATTDASGNLVFAHGLGVVPRAILATPQLTAAAFILSTYAPGITATNVHLVVRDHANAAVASTSVTVNWLAIG